jgi:hypothetical protein
MSEVSLLRTMSGAIVRHNTIAGDVSHACSPAPAMARVGSLELPAVGEPEPEEYDPNAV